MLKSSMIVGYSRVSSEAQDIEKYKDFYEEYEKRTGEKIERIEEAAICIHTTRQDGERF